MREALLGFMNAHKDLKLKTLIPSPACYACDAAACGVTRHNGQTEAACRRHSDPTIAAHFGCYVCSGALRAGSFEGVHAKCLTAQDKGI